MSKIPPTAVVEDPANGGGRRSRQRRWLKIPPTAVVENPARGGGEVNKFEKV